MQRTWKIPTRFFVFILLILGVSFAILLNSRFHLLVVQKWPVKPFKFRSSNLEYKLPSAKAPCPIFTYYQPLSKSVDRTLIEKLEIWGYAFYAHGFYPMILNNQSLQTRQNLRELISRFSKFPTVNPVDYELSCYLRWVALAEQGGGLLVDYDILPMTSSLSTEIRQLRKCHWEQLTTYQSTAPMITHGNTLAIEKWIEYMLNFNASYTVKINNKPHISDMVMAGYAISHGHATFTVKPALPFFHYSSNARITVFSRIQQSSLEMMNRFQHLYYLLHHDVYLPIVPSTSLHSLEIVRSLTLCPDVIPSNDQVDLFCADRRQSLQICKLLTIDGFWSPQDPVNGKCLWKIGPSPADPPVTKETLIVAVLPEPEVYLWRLWLHENSLSQSDLHPHDRDFQSWALRQPKSSMLDALLPDRNKETDVNTRITRLIYSMRSGQALIITEKFVRQVQQSKGIQGLEKWIGAHLGFFLNLTQLNVNWDMKPSVPLSLTRIEEDQRFYSAVEEENQRWTQNWNRWRPTFLDGLLNT